MEIIDLVLLVLGIAGGAAAAAAALYGRYFVLPAPFTGPSICRREAGGCVVLFRSPNASIFGVPNSLLGLLFYAMLITGLWFELPAGILFSAATLALIASVRLGASLLRQRLECRICWTGHFSNALVWMVLGVRYWS